MRAAAVALLLLLAACGSSSDGSSAKPGSTQAAASPAAAQPTSSGPTGKPVPEALLRFRCEKDAKGSWAASGFLVNGGKAAATFQVTVFIGEPTGGAGRAKTKRVENVAPDGSVAFRIFKVPAPKSGGTCHVQVLETK
ncbi:hypothetical protein [Aeromicrobium chenweiae]|uniref:Uncharacterized protein n=1 Tax=Aeromicrobium chenweiae TaxID=2079793 RepID=A0A2S0WR61_9ACTN|nr:hypothetical protein [Aeromicrobium chenweiae]AWB93748.1 hypothetical protein C3E78_16870 [Aeromicrobium chenweiae]TGN30403.1 hypothetical protein E4L97_17125 [Aeromicrobium chenweiae]